nr:PREDICTED: stonustoxin subunit alpha-like [Latimeria chalumnae]|eukprot:XP_014352500.1 PREDICTED: stonustoxin subunit alpha-like [Latimeria chalumnae]
MAEGVGTIEMAALGRPFQLGMLYDCRNDSLVPGVTLWDLDTLNKDLRKMSQHNTDFSIIASDSTEDKSSALSVKTSLKASFLCGLVTVEGSAKYLNDKTTSKQQARVTLQYRTTTTYEQLTMSHLGRHNVTYPDVFDQGTATHVVTAILYGAQAFFVFDRTVSSHENKQDIQGLMKGMINKIPCIEMGSQGSVQIKEQDKLQTNNLSCKFHGDFALPSNPTTFEHAIKIYTDLPKMIGENSEHSVPVRVWLSPLNLLDSKAIKLVHSISIGLVDCSQAVLEELDDFDRQCSDLINHKTANLFPEIGQKIKQFKSMCQRYKFFFQSKLAQLLPLIRGTGKQESLLADLLSTKEKSPFSQHLLTMWLEEKKREINIIKSFLSRMEDKDIEVASSSSELDNLIFDFRVINVFCFMFTSLKQHEPYLADLANYLKSPSDETQFLISDIDNYLKQNIKQWLNSDVSQQMRSCDMLFLKLAEANNTKEKTKFIIASTEDESNPGVSLYLYKNESDLNTDEEDEDEEDEDKGDEDEDDEDEEDEDEDKDDKDKGDEDDEDKDEDDEDEDKDDEDEDDEDKGNEDDEDTGILSKIISYVFKEIMKGFLSELKIEKIDAFCVVVSASQKCFTLTVESLIKAVLMVFGKHSADNIVVLITSSDGKTPFILEKISGDKLPYLKNHDKGFLLHINNSALFVSNSAKKINDEEENFGKIFWNLGENGMRRFFTLLSKLKPINFPKQ